MTVVEMAQPDEGLKKAFTNLENGASSKPKPGSRRRRLTPLGQGWKRGLYPPEMNMPQSNITCMLYYQEAPALSVLADSIEKNIWPRYRFHSLVVDMDFVAQDGPMDRAYHFQEKEMGSLKEIEDYTFGIASQPMDPDHPLWRFEIVRNKTGNDVMILKLHHCLTDGLGVLFAFLPTLELASGGDVLDSIPLPAALKGGSKQPGEAPVERMSSEERRMGCCRRRCKNNSSFWKGMCSALTMGYDSELKMGPKITERKPYLAYSGRHVFTKMPAIPTERIKAVRAVHKCTFNDAIMAALAGGFRRYSIEKLNDPLFTGGQAEQDIECKAFMLLALPRPVTASDPDAALVNNFLTPVLKLAVNEPTPKGRLDATIAACNELKSRSYVSGIYTTTKALSAVLPASVLSGAVSEAISKLTCNITSVPLPDETMLFQGKAVEGIQMIFLNNIPQISILSYNGALNWNMVSDPALIAEPEAFGKFVEEEMEALAKA